ncbi:MAG: hypothetical protein ABSF84_02745 [Acidimicrobiales bacterium]|jgi:hypothetical protein
MKLPNAGLVILTAIAVAGTILCIALNRAVPAELWALDLALVTGTAGVTVPTSSTSAPAVPAAPVPMATAAAPHVPAAAFSGATAAPVAQTAAPAPTMVRTA